MTRSALPLALTLLLAACGDRSAPDGTAAPAVDDGAPGAPLPAPEAPQGASVTGMPTRPPPHPVESSADAAADTPTLAPDAASMSPPPEATDAITAPTPTPSAAEASTSVPNAPPPPAASELAAATGVVTQYMAALGAGALVKAQGLWLTTPNDSTVLQLARGGPLTVSVGGAAADATGRVTVPVDVRGTDADGREHHLQVGYALQRSSSGVWRLLSADVRDVAP